MWPKSQFFVGVFSALVVCFGLWTVFYFQMLGFRTEQNAINIAAWYDKKAELSRAIPSPRIIFVGGSNAFYGLNTKQLSADWNVPVFNYGTHAGLTLNYLLYKVRQIARPGDLVVLTLEYEFFRHSDALNSTAIEYYIGGDPEYLNQLNFSQKMQCFFTPSLDAFGQLLARRSPRYQERLKQKEQETNRLMNEHGDHVGQMRSSMTESMKATMEGIPPVNSLKTRDLTDRDYAWSEVRALAKWCSKHQVSLAATYANTIDDASFHEAPTQANFLKIRERYESLGIPVLGTGVEGLRPREDFFDTVYHLNEEGQVARTTELEKIMRPFIEEWKARRTHPDAI